MDRDTIKEALRKNREKQKGLDGETKEELEEKAKNLEADADHLRDEAHRKEREAKEIKQRIRKGDYGVPADQEQELEALKEEEERLKRVLKRMKPDKVTG